MVGACFSPTANLHQRNWIEETTAKRRRFAASFIIPLPTERINSISRAATTNENYAERAAFSLLHLADSGKHPKKP